MLHDSRLHPEAKRPASPIKINAVRLGAYPVIDEDEEITKAVQLARESDVAVIVVGLNPYWESEGFDRSTLSLPWRTNELIDKVVAVNPATVVVVQAGSAVSMPWKDKVGAIVHAWYGGNESGNSIADVLYGKVNPAGRLPITFPIQEEDIPAALNFKSGRTQTHYEEGIWVGYRHYNARKVAPLFPFGYGLSYTIFKYSDLSIVEKPKKSPIEPDDWRIVISVKVTNAGRRKGDHSIHFYTCPPAETPTSLKFPAQTIQAFSKVYDLEPNASKTVTVVLDKCE